MPGVPETLRKSRFLASIETAATCVAAVALAAVALLSAAAICLRAVGLNLPDALDLASLFMAVAVFWGMVSAALRDEFIKVDAILLLLGPRGITVLRTVSGLITAGFLVILARAGIEQLELTFRSGEVTPQLRFPLWPLLALGLSGLVVTAFAALALLSTLSASPASSRDAEVNRGE